MHHFMTICGSVGKCPNCYNWSSRSEKTLLKSTAKHLGVHICQIYLGKTDDEPPQYQTAMTTLQI